MAASVQDVIFLLGDSLTQGASVPRGFAQQLSYIYNRKLDVLNRGLSGYNSTWAIPVFEQCLAKRNERTGLPKVRILTIWFGANDACIPGTLQHVPLPLFSQNLSTIIQMVASPSSEWYSPETKIILLTPPPVNTKQRGDELAGRTPPRPLDRSFEVTAKYAEAVREVGKKENVPVIDVYTKLWEGCGKVEENLVKYLYDGLHVNADAYDIIFQDIVKTIEHYYPEYQHDKLNTVFATWDKINPENPLPDLQKREIFN